MKIVIAGGTGFLGRPLSESLARDGHRIVTLTRGNKPSTSGPSSTRTGGIEFATWVPNGDAGAWASVVDDGDAVINLAGESIAEKRWTDAQKARILDSRRLATRSLVQAMARTRRSRVFISGSAVGYYGPLGDELVNEDHAPGDDFLARVCHEWEVEAVRASESGARVVRVRTGLVLERDGGALPKMLPPFWFGAGGPVGNGRQYWPWIHRKDWIDLVRWSIATTAVEGPLNATAPNPVTNAAFAKALGRAVKRPAFMPAPGFALKLLLGEMAEALLLSGQRAVPTKAERLGFPFAYRDLDTALLALFQ